MDVFLKKMKRKTLIWTPIATPQWKKKIGGMLKKEK